MYSKKPEYSKIQVGFKWDIGAYSNGKWEWEPICNLVPIEGMNHILNVVVKLGSQTPNWYVALFEGDYTPTNAITGASFAATATECVAYSETTRQLWSSSAVSGGATDNIALPAAFTFASNKTIYGAALIGDNVKGGIIGPILSIVRFSSPKINPELLNVKAGIALINS